MKWKILNALNDLYTKGKTEYPILEEPLVKRLMDMEIILKQGRSYLPTAGFAKLYEKKYAESHSLLSEFLSTYKDVPSSFSVEELGCLQRLAAEKEKYFYNTPTLKELSTTYFGGAKVVGPTSLLAESICHILEIDSLAFDELDRQYLMVLHARQSPAEAILLCENENLLPKPRLDKIEIWNAGGNNTTKLEFLPEVNIHVYYHCDWDPNGIAIFKSIREKYLPGLKLALPLEYGAMKPLLPGRSWEIDLSSEDLGEHVKIFLEHLVSGNAWIEEESIRSIRVGERVVRLF